MQGRLCSDTVQTPKPLGISNNPVRNFPITGILNLFAYHSQFNLLKKKKKQKKSNKK